MTTPGFMTVIHRYIDASGRPTYTYERIATLLLEALLLFIAALPVVTSWRSAGAAVLVAVLRLYETELRREDASVYGRHREAGGVTPLPETKLARATWRAQQLAIVSWTWPGLVTFVQAAESAKWSGLGASVAVTVARVAWGRVIVPRWRDSRLAWRARFG